MAQSETAVGNAALAKLGQGAVLSFDDPDERARWLKSRFADVRDLVLRSNRWSFALGRTKLTAEATAPAFGWARAFPLPTDCLQLVEAEGLPRHALEGGRILADETGPLNVRYLRRVTDVSAWDPLFAEAVACRLAYELAEKLTQSGTKKDAALRDYQLALREAFRVNAIETPSTAVPDGDWVAARF